MKSLGLARVSGRDRCNRWSRRLGPGSDEVRNEGYALSLPRLLRAAEEYINSKDSRTTRR